MPVHMCICLIQMCAGVCVCRCVCDRLRANVGVYLCACHICRFGIGRFTTEEEIRYTVEKCIKVVQRLREMRYV